MDKNELREKLNQAYSKAGWLNILGFIFPQLELLATPDVKAVDAEHVESFEQLGSIALACGSKLAVMEVVVDDQINLPRNRVHLRKLTRDFIDGENFQGVLAVFVNNGKNDYRLTLAARDGRFTAEGMFEEFETDSKRYTYLLGENEVCTTAANRLFPLNDRADEKTLQDVINAFSVERLNKEFYTKIQKFFYELVGGKTEKRAYRGILQLPSVDASTPKGHETCQEFAVRLLGRIVFCWFLKFKRPEDGGEPLITSDILSLDAVKNSSGYYHSILEKLFFMTLNTPLDERDKQHSLSDSEKIPFLNGGLFDARRHDYYEKGDLGVSKHINTLVIPDKWFLDFFEMLESYNFTIDENSIKDVQVSIDPEILGRIFENLLAEIDPDTGETARKKTGSFYTPREVVDYMVEQSLVQYLKTATNLEEKELIELFDESVEAPGRAKNKMITKALSRIKIIDPACGSGAFPVGCLQKCIDILRKTDPDNDSFLSDQIEKIESMNLPNDAQNALIEKLEHAFETNEADYGRKLALIQGSLYGVDLQPIAVEIAKLRFFLSLIVDEKIMETEGNRGIEPLPNLEFKFVAANTLLSVDEFIDSENPLGLDFEEKFWKDFEKATEDYFYAQTPQNKVDVKHTIEQLISSKIKQQNDRAWDIGFNNSAKGKKKKDSAKESERLYNLSAQWSSYRNLFSSDKHVDFFVPKYFFPDAKDGFDIVIGNPPYVQLQANGGELADIYKDCGYETFARMGDIYCLFYEKALDISRKDGVTCFITSNSWMKAGYGAKTRDFFSSKTVPTKLINLGADVFESATVDTNILFLQKSDKKALPFPGLEIAAATEFHKIKESMWGIVDIHSATWGVLSEFQYGIKTHIENLGSIIKGLDIDINYGIKTGFNDAFIIDTATRNEIIEAAPNSEEIIKPVFRGRDVQHYKAEWPETWLINTHNGLRGKLEPVQIKNYPAVKNYLDQWYDALAKRQDKGVTPYNLRNCAYLGDFEKEKIAWLELTNKGRFCISEPGEFSLNTTYMMSGDNLRFICAYLNSSLVTWYFDKICATSGVGTNRWIKQYVEQIPVPQLDEDRIASFENIVNYILIAKEHGVKDMTGHLDAAPFYEELADLMVFGIYFKNQLKERKAYINDDIDAYLPRISMIDDLEEQKSVISEHYTELKKEPFIARALLEYQRVDEIKEILS